jgi:hypothetical protein
LDGKEENENGTGLSPRSDSGDWPHEATETGRIIFISSNSALQIPVEMIHLRHD